MFREEEEESEEELEWSFVGWNGIYHISLYAAQNQTFNRNTERQTKKAFSPSHANTYEINANENDEGKNFRNRPQRGDEKCR